MLFILIINIMKNDKTKSFNTSLRDKLKINEIDSQLQKKFVITGGVDKIQKSNYINKSKEPQRTTFSLYKNLNTQIGTKINKKEKESVLSAYNSGNSGLNSSHTTERVASAYGMKSKELKVSTSIKSNK